MVAALVLVVLVVLAGVSGDTGRWGLLALAAVSVLWLTVNNPMEGPILLTVLPGHGLTGADLAGLTGLGLAGWRVVRMRARRGRFGSEVTLASSGSSASNGNAGGERQRSADPNWIEPFKPDW